MGPKRQRGRGRGASVGKTGGLYEDSASQEAVPDDTPLSQTLSNEPSKSTAPLLPNTVRFRDNVSQKATPNTSPASAPTETPVPTPIKPPVRRLDSLGLSERGGPAHGQGVGGRVMAGKYKPRVTTRRALADRVQAQREEDEQRKEREIEAEMELDSDETPPGGTVHRGRGHWAGMRGRVRGRGEAMGRAGLDRSNKPQREASGVFGVAPAATGKKAANLSQATSAARLGVAGKIMEIDTKNASRISDTRSSHSNITPAQSNSMVKVKGDPDTLPNSGTDESPGGHPDSQLNEVKAEILDPVYPEEQVEGSQPLQRIDIEMINLVTDDEDEDFSDAVQTSKNKGKGRILPNKGGLKPVRVKREQHRERVTLVNTDPVAKAFANDAEDSGNYHTIISSDEDESRQVQSSRDSKTWSGVWQDDGEEKKHDPSASDDVMEIEIIENPNTSAKRSHVPSGQVSGDMGSTSSSLVDKEKKKRKARPKQKQPVLQTEEDKAEHIRHLEDLRILAQELGGVQVSQTNDNDAGIDEHDRESTAGQPRVRDHEGRLYLFQFPPKLPSLVNEIKKEEAADSGLDLMEVDTGPSNTAADIDLTKPDPEEAVFIDTPRGTFQIPREMVTEEGLAGKLIVRKSGRVQLDWGGILLELGRGVETDYLTTTVIVDDNNNGEVLSGESSTSQTGTATGMGKVMGTFVLTPDFEAMGLM